MIKFINKLSRQKADEEEVEVEAPTAESYLEEIRDLLAQQTSQTPNSLTKDLSNRPKGTE